MPTTINKQMLQEFRKDFAATVEPLQKKYGMVLALGSIRFDSNQFQSRFTAILADKETTSSGMDPRRLMQKIALEKEGSMYNDIKDCYGKVFYINDKRYVIVGLRTNSRKRPLCIQDVRTGKQFVLPMSDPFGHSYTEMIKSSKLWFDFQSGKVQSTK
jgi:hypothetical protein